MDNFGSMEVNMGVTVRVISKGGEEASENKTSKQEEAVVTEQTAVDIPSESGEKDKTLPFRYDKGYKAKTAYTRFGFGAVIAVGAVISAVMLLSFWAVKSFGSEEASALADRIICEIA